MRCKVRDIAVLLFIVFLVISQLDVSAVHPLLKRGGTTYSTGEARHGYLEALFAAVKRHVEGSGSTDVLPDQSSRPQAQSKTVEFQDFAEGLAKFQDNVIGSFDAATPQRPQDVKQNIRSANSEQSRLIVKSAVPESQADADIVHAPDILFVVYTDSLFYKTRMKYVMKTWGSVVSPEMLLLIGDKPGSVAGHKIEPSKCQPHSHWEGACCKYAAAVYSAHMRMRDTNKLTWAYFTDDDAYVVVPNMVHALHGYTKSLQRRDGTVPPVNLGIHGCRTKKCHGLCAGGGFALSREALDKLVGHAKHRRDFIEQEMSVCAKCERWADQALSTLIQQRRVQEIPMPGLHGWFLDSKRFSATLSAGVPPLMYHYIRTEGQMKFLHRLFDSKGAREQCEAKSSGQRCVRYGKRKCCTASDRQEDIPWSPRVRKLEGRRLRLHYSSLKRSFGLSGPWPVWSIEERFRAMSVGAQSLVRTRVELSFS